MLSKNWVPHFYSSSIALLAWRMNIFLLKIWLEWALCIWKCVYSSLTSVNALYYNTGKIFYWKTSLYLLIIYSSINYNENVREFSFKLRVWKNEEICIWWMTIKRQDLLVKVLIREKHNKKRSPKKEQKYDRFLLRKNTFRFWPSVFS